MSIEELIPLLIGAGYLILKAVGAANKKKEAAQQPRRAIRPFDEEEESAYEYYDLDKEKDPVPQKDPHQVLREMLEVAQKGAIQPVAIPALDLPVAMESAGESQLYSNDKLPLVEEADTLQSAKILDQMREESQKGEFKENAKEASYWDDKVFDMRQAVIYSEILQPKFID